MNQWLADRSPPTSGTPRCVSCARWRAGQRATWRTAAVQEDETEERGDGDGAPSDDAKVLSEDIGEGACSGRIKEGGVTTAWRRDTGYATVRQEARRAEGGGVGGGGP
jgi:hypothetical protein